MQLKYITLDRVAHFPSATYECELIASHENFAWIRMSRKWNHKTSQFEPAPLRSFHTVNLAELRDEPPNREARLTLQ